MAEHTYTANIINIGGKYYIGLEKELKDFLEPGDLVEFQIIAVAPQGRISESRKFEKTIVVARTPKSSARMAPASFKDSGASQRDAGVAESGQMHRDVLGDMPVQITILENGVVSIEPVVEEEALFR